MKIGTAKDIVLGIAVTHRAVHGVLVKDHPDGPKILRHFDRPRSGMEGMGGEAVEFQVVEEQDPEVSFVAGAVAEEGGALFLASEFDGADPVGSEGGFGSSMLPSTIEIELTDILDECAESGYPDPQVVFCVASTDLDFHEFQINSRQKPGTDREPAPRDRSKKQDSGKLLQHLAASTDAKFDPDQTVFIPMTPSESRVPRYAAVCARPSEIIVPTLKRLAARKRRVSVSVIETEYSLIIGMVRMLAKAEDEGKAPPSRLLVRVGADDTIIMLMEGQNLAHIESLRSITSFDSADTVCSRILLMQDERGFGDPDQILVLGEENEAVLVRRITEFFDDSEVQSVRSLLPRSEDDLDEEYTRESTLAASAVLRHLTDQPGKSIFEPVNLLPKKLFRRSLALSGVKWHAIPMLVLLFASVLFMVQRYFDQAHEAELLRQKLSSYPVELVESNKGDLQARIDSIEAVTQGYIDALAVLDSILVGSDTWSRTLDRTATEAASVPGIWIEKWEEDSRILTLEGTATDRNQVVRYAARMDGLIESVSFDEIRDWPVYKFTMKVPLPNELPQAAQYLRQQASTSE